jgi:hypothetical protein
VDTPDSESEKPEESEQPDLGIDPMALLAGLLNASGVLKVRKRPRRKRP